MLTFFRLPIPQYCQAKIIVLLFIVAFAPYTALCQEDSIPQWRKLLLQQTASDTIAQDSLSNILRRIKDRPQDSLSSLPTPAISIGTPKDTITVPLSAETTMVVANNIKPSPIIKVPVTFDERLLHIIGLSAAAVDSIETSGLSEKAQDNKNKATSILEAENPAKIIYIWGYAISKSDFDFLLPRSLGFYQTLRRKNGLPEEDKRTCIIKVMYLLDSIDNRIITKKHLLDVNKRLGEISRNKNILPNVEAANTSISIAPSAVVPPNDSITSVGSKPIPVVVIPAPVVISSGVVKQTSVDSLALQRPVEPSVKKDSLVLQPIPETAIVAIPAQKAEPVKTPPLTFEQRLSRAMTMSATAVDSLENSGISDKIQDDKNKASRILMDENPVKILYIWGYAIAKNDFDFLLPRSLGYYQTIRKNSGLQDEEKHTAIIKTLYLMDSLDNRIISKKYLLDITKRLAEISSVNRIQPGNNTDSIQIVAVPKTIKLHNDTSSTFEERFFRVLHYPAAKIDSIEASGLSTVNDNEKNRASIILGEDSPADVSIVWGFATSNKDFNFFPSRNINDYRTIRTKIGLKDEEDKRISIIKILYLADTLQDRIISHREFVEITKKISTLASQKITGNDNLQYNRIAIPSDEITREVLKDNLSKIELLPGGFKTSLPQKMQIQKRILEIYGPNKLGKLTQLQYDELLKAISFQSDTNKDRILTGAEVRTALFNMRNILQEANIGL